MNDRSLRQYRDVLHVFPSGRSIARVTILLPLASPLAAFVQSVVGFPVRKIYVHHRPDGEWQACFEANDPSESAKAAWHSAYLQERLDRRVANAKADGVAA